MKIFQKNHGKKTFIFLLIFLLLITFFSIYKLFIYMTPERMASFPGSAQSEETCESEIPDCQVCYLLNLDGMKGLGHSALLLIDETGAGQLFSYNGMQYGLLPCLLGKEGIGKMKVISMTPEETAVFLETGEPPASASHPPADLCARNARGVSFNASMKLPLAYTMRRDFVKDLCAFLGALVFSGASAPRLGRGRFPARFPLRIQEF